mmetsp:Transcript_18865/g.38096  ORF Transcript_18865/g.38096 Transcript_18865/m.38096 type:complete len:343 (+) Transcript_18865:86-1114(+)
MMMAAVTTANRKDCRGYYDNIRRLLNPQPFANFILGLIFINSIMMGIATFPFVKDDDDLRYKFDLVDQIFLIIFTIESAMQLLYFGLRGFFRDGFRVFDLLIVILSWAMEGTQVIRAFRIFRASRLITRIETMRNLVLAIFNVMPKMTAIFLLLILIFFIFGVMFTTLFKGMYLDGELTEPFFESLFYSFFTLFQMMTMDSWSTIMKQIQEEYPTAWIPFVIFIILTGFVVVNLIIAVICDAVSILGGVDNNAGLSAYAAEDGRPKEVCIDGENYNIIEQKVEGGGKPSSQLCTTTAQRLEELQKQLDDLVVAQDQMRRVIEVLSSRASMVKIKSSSHRNRR